MLGNILLKLPVHLPIMRINTVKDIYLEAFAAAFYCGEVWMQFCILPVK
jgi:hypothetical protein